MKLSTSHHHCDHLHTVFATVIGVVFVRFVINVVIGIIRVIVSIVIGIKRLLIVNIIRIALYWSS